MFARPRGFHRCVERQQVGLESDFINDFDDFGDVRAGGVDIIHRAHHLLHHAAAFFRMIPHGNRHLIALHGVFGIEAGLRRHFVDRSRNFFHGAGRFRRALRQGLAGVGDLPRSCRHLVCRGRHLPQYVIHGNKGAVQGFLHNRIIALIVAFHLHIQITLRHFLQAAYRFVDRRHHCVQRLVHAFDDTPVLAAMVRRIRAFFQISFNGFCSQAVNIAHNMADIFAHHNQPFVNLIVF